MPDRLPGCATPEATRTFAEGQPHRATGYVPLGQTGLTVSRLGFGGYRIDDETAGHREALDRALLAGCNLIDTSTNYTDGASETLVGQVVRNLVERGMRRREEVVVVSKIGYVQGRNLELAERREREGRPFPEVVKYQPGCWHCIHPEFLGDQLDRSLERLGIAALDVCLLHNPEYFLSDAAKHGGPNVAESRDEFYRRLAEAFRHLESQVAAGRVGAYGVSSNTCTAAADGADATSLSRMVDAAREAGGAKHHFRVLQLPLNLIESGAVLTANTGAGGAKTVLELARATSVAVLVNRPLNAIAGNGMLRLADVAVGDPAVSFDGQLARVAELEGEFRRAIAAPLAAATRRAPMDPLFRWAEELAPIRRHLQGLEHWSHVEGQIIAPQVNQTVGVLNQIILGGPLQAAWFSFRERYLAELTALLDEIRRLAAQRSRDTSRSLAAVLDPFLPSERRGESLSRKALWVVASTPGVSSVLNGMRTTAYVDDALGVLAWTPLDAVETVYRRFREVAVA